jgi:hypothetical protein
MRLSRHILWILRFSSSCPDPRFIGASLLIRTSERLLLDKDVIYLRCGVQGHPIQKATTLADNDGGDNSDEDCSTR